MRKNTIILAIIALLIISALFYYFSAREAVAPAGVSGIPIENKFEDKIVYTTDSSFDKKVLISDCRERGGKFNECGNFCDTTDNNCVAAVCAYTCEFEIETEDFGKPGEFTAETAKLKAVGGFTADGIATREYDGLSFIHTITARLDDSGEDKFYEGWLTKDGDFFSTGKLVRAGAGYALTYVNENDKSDYQEIVVTLETASSSLDNNPKIHVLEGNFLAE